MAIKIDCPRCKTPLLVPNKLAGGYANCPHCKGRFWVAKDATADATPIDAVRVLPADGAAVAAAAPQQSVASSTGVPLRGVPGAAVPPAPPAAAAASPPPALSKPPARRLKKASASVPAPPAPPPPPVRQKKVARLISAEAADSTLRLAADGKLPELQLEEDAATQKPETRIQVAQSAR